MLRLKLFGEFDLTEASGVAVAVTSRKDAALLAYLCLQARPVDRSVLTDLLWPDRAEEQARKSLRQSLVALRRLLNRDGELLPADGGERISLDHARISVDVREFEAHARKGRGSAAIELYAGPLLERFPSPSTPYAAWLDVERARFGDMACGILADLAEAHLANVEWERAKEVSRRLVETDPLREAGHRLLMRALNGAGRRNEALQQFHRLKDMLRDELDVSPDNMTADLYQSIREPATRAASTDTAATVSNIHDAPQPGPDIPSIAVLPFDNRSRDIEFEYFGDGLAEDILTNLSKVGSLFVIARNSSFSYRNDARDARNVAGELGVRYVLKGSVRASGNRLRITAQLIDADDGHHVWAERYDRVVDDIFDIQDEITKEIVSALRVRLTDGEIALILNRETNSIDAWKLCVEATELMLRYDVLSSKRARDLAQQALDIDQNYAHANAVMALSYWVEARQGLTSNSEELYERANEIGQRAIDIGANSPWGYASKGLAAAGLGKMDEAIKTIEVGLSIIPGNADLIACYGLAVMKAGDFAEAVTSIEAAMHLNPFPPGAYYSSLSRAYEGNGQMELAYSICREGLQKYPDSFALIMSKVSLSARRGKQVEAESSLAQFREIAPHFRNQFTRKYLFIDDEAFCQRYIEGLRIAGLPD